MDVARLNFSHGTHEAHRNAFASIRGAAAELGRNVAVMADLQGPKMRTGRLEGGGPVELVEGAQITITTREVPGDAECVSTTYEHLPNDVKPGDRVLLADGTMELTVERVSAHDIVCSVLRGGPLDERKGINLPGVNVSAPSLTEKDVTDLEFAVGLGVDFVALSFVRSAYDIHTIRGHIDTFVKASAGEHSDDWPGPGVIAKIERPEALEHFDDILALSDAIMVARGDLGIEVPLDDVPQIQKDLIQKCNYYGKPVITATQMLESMITNARPTRAEVTDVANAIYDGTDAVMLSGETAVGRYPAITVRTMAGIAGKADRALALHPRPHQMRPTEDDIWHGSHSDAIGDAACRMSTALNVSQIVCFTQSGYTAQAMARYRPCTPITAITLGEETLRRCSLIWGVQALHTDEVVGIDEMVQTVDGLLLQHQLGRPGDTILIVAGTPLAVGGVTNLLNLHIIGETLSPGGLQPKS